eukprot:c41687_g1_i1 orf=83-232(-)
MDHWPIPNSSTLQHVLIVARRELGETSPHSIPALLKDNARALKTPIMVP